MGLVCVTAPVLGVIIGGQIIDRSSKKNNLYYCFNTSFKLIFTSYIFINLFTLVNHPLISIICLWIGIGFGKFINF